MNKEINYNYKLPPFKWFCLTNFPFIEADFDALTYYELLCKVVQYLNEVIVKTNAIGEQTEELTNAFNTLKEYVDTYFDNLDVQKEINNKLDEMAESGELEEIISQYLNSTAIFGFDTVDDMKSATNLINGSYAKTYGYYSKNDGGNAFYYITDTSNNNITSIELNNGLYANILFNGIEINGKKFGLHADKETDDTIILQAIINYCKENNFTLILDGYSYVSDTINTKGIKIKGKGVPDRTYATFKNIGWDYLKGVNAGANVTFNEYVEETLKTGSGIISDINKPIVICNRIDGLFDLENLCICGWIRSANQEGLKSTYDSSLTYLNGKHKFNNVNVINCGSHAIHLNSLETTEVHNLNVLYNFGYGIYIEGVENIDTPFEYTQFNYCQIEGNKLGGIYAKNSFRKAISFNNCNFSRNGLYRILDKPLETESEDRVSAIKIEGKESSSNANRNDIEVTSCYAEELSVFLNVQTPNLITSYINFHNNIQYTTENNIDNKMLILNCSYSGGLNFYGNTLNDALAYNSKIKIQNGAIVPRIVDNDFYINYVNVPTMNFSNKLNVTSQHIYKYGNLIEIDVEATTTDELSAYETLMSNIPNPLNTLRKTININNIPQLLNVYANGQINSPLAIQSGKSINFSILYFTQYD